MQFELLFLICGMPRYVMGAWRCPMLGKLPNAIADKMIINSGESDDAIGVGNAHPSLRGHNKAVFTTFWWPDIACSADDLARTTARKVAKHTGG